MLTDNSFLGDKIALRLSLLPKKDILTVCDAYSGKGTIWKNIQKSYEGNIIITKIDKVNQENFILLGDNRKFLSAIDLKQYDIVDLDAYGIPYEQLVIVFKSGFKGIIFITFIQTIYGGLPDNFLISLGYTKKMIDKCKSLFFKNGFEKFKNFLSLYNVRKIVYRKRNRVVYLGFEI